MQCSAQNALSLKKLLIMGLMGRNDNNNNINNTHMAIWYYSINIIDKEIEFHLTIQSF